MTGHDHRWPPAFIDDRVWPRRPPNHALVDDLTDAVLTDAVVSLVQLRGLEWRDGLAELHALASLAIELRLQIPDAVWRAVDQDYSWSDVADQLGVTPTTVRRRYANSVRVPMAD